MLFHLNLNRELETIPKVADNCQLIEGLDRIEFPQDRLEMLKMGYPVLGFFQLILEVLLKLTPDTINKGLRASKNIPEERFEDGLCDGSSVFMAALVFFPSNSDKAIRK